MSAAKQKEPSARLPLAKVNAEFARQGIQARLSKGARYFYFWSGEAADWFDRTVQVERMNDLDLAGWIAKFQELKRRNQAIVRQAKTLKAR